MVNFDIEEVAFEYQATGESLTKLAKKYNTTRQTLARYFKDMGIEVINRQNETKFDETIFDCIDTEEKAYWLGFLYADGNISNTDTSAIKKAYMIELSLKGFDYQHLEKFNIFTKYRGNNVKLNKSTCSGKEFSRCRWSVANKHVWMMLNEKGCTPQKSLILKFPDKSIFKSEDLIRHFIRGYFDGDGCITRQINIHTVSPHINILGTPEFLERILEYSKISGNIRRDKRRSEQTRILEYRVNEGVQFINYLYENSTIYLDRKYKLYQFFKNGSRSVEEFTELLQTNIGEDCDVNTEITEETKESSAS